MQGKVSFSTRYETRTRLVDEDGREIFNEVVGEGGEVPVGEQEEPHVGTSAEGVEFATMEKGQNEASKLPPSVGVERDVKMEKDRVDGAGGGAEPESEVGKETGRDEL